MKLNPHQTLELTRLQLGEKSVTAYLVVSTVLEAENLVKYLMDTSAGVPYELAGPIGC
jgi:hypothetical protein